MHVEKPVDCFYNVPDENLDFIERTDILTNMKTELEKNRILVLKGLGGMGKTELMLRYCHLHRDAYEYIFWLEVDDWNVAVNSFYKLATTGLSMSKETVKGDDTEFIRHVHVWFKEKEKAKVKWLLLLNNCDGDDMDKKIFELIPQARGNVILTTRLHILSKKAMTIRVDQMKEEEALRLLLGTSTMDSIDKESEKFIYAQKIVAKLDCIPLAVNLARAYIYRTRIDHKGYLDLYLDQTERVQLLDSNESNDLEYTHTLKSVWKLSLNQIRKINPVATNILNVCAFLYPEKIPDFIFIRQWSALELIDLATKNQNHSKRHYESNISKAITILVEYSFLIPVKYFRDERAGVVTELLTIHRLVQTVIHDEMTMDQRQYWHQRLATAFQNEIVSGDYHDLDNRQKIDAYIPHFRHFVQRLEDDDINTNQSIARTIIYPLNTMVVYFYQSGQYFVGEDLAQKNTSINTLLNGPEHPDTAISLNNLAGLYDKQGKFDDAEMLYRQALAIRERVLGLEHPDTATSLNSLAAFYNTQGRYDNAESLHKQALTIYEKMLGPEHPNTAMSLNNLALLYKNQGKYDDAELLLKQALAVCEKMLGPNHPDTAATLGNLASLYNNLDKYDDAELLYNQALTICEKVLGPEHPDTAIYMNELAGFYRDQNEYDDAELLYKRALAINEKVLGPEHPDTVISLNNLALLYGRRGMFDDAEQLFKQSLVLNEMVLGPKHPFTTVSLILSAYISIYQNKCNDAELLFKRALAIREKISGPEHLDVAKLLHVLALFYLCQGKYSDAEPIFKQALVISEKVLGPEHTHTMTIRKNLTLFYRCRGDDKSNVIQELNIFIKGDLKFDINLNLFFIRTIFNIICFLGCFQQ